MTDLTNLRSDDLHNEAAGLITQSTTKQSAAVHFALSAQTRVNSHPRLLTGRPGQRVGLLHRAVVGVVQALHRLVLPHHQAVHHPEHDGLQGEPERHRGHEFCRD